MPLHIDNETALFASLALPNRSDAVALYNAALYATGTNSAYLAFEPTDLAHAILGMKALGIRGFSISSPFKQEVLRHLDEVEEAARVIGAVNTVVNNGGHLCGYNTDWQGAIAALEEVTCLSGKHAAIVGAGGAARAIAFGLTRKHAQVAVYNRTLRAAERLARDLGCALGGTLVDLRRACRFDIVVNATIVGSHLDASSSPIPATCLARETVVLDAVFSPAETILLQVARQIGCPIVSGRRMLLYQAALQIELFTGVQVPLESFESGRTHETFYESYSSRRANTTN